MSLKQQKILSIDIGGSHVKSSILDTNGRLLEEYKKLDTPSPATPEAVIQTIEALCKGQIFDKIAVGFPGYIRNGVVMTAPNLGTKLWTKVDLSSLLTSKLGKPARVINDADMLGLGVIGGKGLEMMITLGTGFGTALFLDGLLLPHLELAHHPISKNKTYDKYIGDKALKKHGKKKWRKRMTKVIRVLKTVFNYDTLYIGGGNAKYIKDELDPNIVKVTNLEGIDGGAALWKLKAVI
ncbi:MAG TPA: ROK family protein [Saprospiraceae bacterium]|nr:ROK family protein [Saprospiraceae bacterium]